MNSLKYIVVSLLACLAFTAPCSADPLVLGQPAPCSNPFEIIFWVGDTSELGYHYYGSVWCCWAALKRREPSPMGEAKTVEFMNRYLAQCDAAPSSAYVSLTSEFKLHMALNSPSLDETEQTGTRTNCCGSAYSL